ncbi:scavenger receptor cysteine-rich domain-containing protein DMBT1-like [Branchiostoma floridae x Branchiostoma japonicum]
MITVIAVPTSAPGCGGILTAPPGGTVTSPNYPENYGNDETCEWMITVPEESVVLLTFDSFHLEDGSDYLEIYEVASDSASYAEDSSDYSSSYDVASDSASYAEDGSDSSSANRKLQSLTGQVLVNNIISTSNQIFVRFTSDESTTAQGFRFSYIDTASDTAAPTSAPGCGGILTAPPGGTVTSPNFPDNYGNEEYCEWTITVPEGSVVLLTFDSFHIEDGVDHLTIYDGGSDSDTELLSLTGETSVHPFTSTSNQMFVRFTSDWTFTLQGFQFSYTDTDTAIAAPTIAPGCGGILTAPPGGTVTSPNYPDNYGNEEYCEWTITVPEGSVVLLTFDSFHIEEDYDYLTIYDGGSDSDTELLSLTGETSVHPFTSTSNQMFVRFTSDWLFTLQGFQFSYTDTDTVRGRVLAVPDF